MSYECSTLILRSCTNNEHSCNVEIRRYINIKLRYYIYHKTELLLSVSTAQATSNVQNPNDSFSFQLLTFYEHSHLNIHTIFILNYEGIISEYSSKHSWIVPWMLASPLGRQYMINQYCTILVHSSIRFFLLTLLYLHLTHGLTHTDIFFITKEYFEKHSKKTYWSCWVQQFLFNHSSNITPIGELYSKLPDHVYTPDANGLSTRWQPHISGHRVCILFTCWFVLRQACGNLEFRFSSQLCQLWLIRD